MSFEHNPYQPPKEPLSSDEPSVRPRRDALEPATRGARLLASLLDGVATMIAVLPVMFYLGLFSHPEELRTQITAFLLGFLSVLLLHGYLLHMRGQTIGKAIVGIQIVNIDGSRATLSQIVFRRYLPVQLFSAIPAIGSLVALLDVVWIFRADSRCLHDHIAGTMVINYLPKEP